MAKKIRYFVLLLVLFVVAVEAWLQKSHSTSWQRPLWVHVYAVNGDGSSVGEAYIQDLERQDFKAIEAFINAEGKRYGLNIDAFEILYGGVLPAGPPHQPEQGSMLENIWWSLSFRFWSMVQAWQADNSFSDIDLYVNYYDPASNPRLRDSVCLQGGMIGIVNAYADPSYRGSNHFVIAHELMHTVGARDRYDYSNSLPIFPQGYAEPQKSPLYPQTLAEIMGGRIPQSTAAAIMPESLKQAMVGEVTAREINWIR